MTTTASLFTDEVRNYFAKLRSELWRRGPNLKYRTNISRSTFSVPTEEKVRELTCDEMKQVLKYVETCSLPLEIVSSNMGFSFSFRIYEPDNPLGKVNIILFFEGRQVPAEFVGSDSGQDKKARDDKENKVFEYFEKLLNAEKNIDLLKKFKLDLPQNRDYYTY
jgi:hypothetical protein